jgi:hypothetical protein
MRLAHTPRLSRLRRIHARHRCFVGNRHGIRRTNCSCGDKCRAGGQTRSIACPGGTQYPKRPMNISIVDTSSVLAGSTAVEAFRTPVELAQLADQAGSSRYRLSELHSVLTNAGATPEVAVAAVASRNEQPARRLGRGSAEPSQPVPGRRDVPSITRNVSGSHRPRYRSRYVRSVDRFRAPADAIGGPAGRELRGPGH